MLDFPSSPIVGQVFPSTPTAGVPTYTWDGEKWTSNQADTPVNTIAFLIDGGGTPITTGVKGTIEIPFACIITGWTLLADVSGSIVVDIWKDSYANYPPVVGDVITASAKPTISSSNKGQSSTLTGWTTSIVAGDILTFNVNSATSISRVTLNLKVIRT